MWFQGIIEILFSLALFVNAALFIPQAIRLLQKEDSSELSLTTFAGFNAIQLLTALHGFINHDPILTIGSLLSLLTCGIVTLLIVYYRIKN